MGEDRWFRVSSSLMRHDKSRLLSALLEEPRAWSYVVELWAWAVECHGDGRVECPRADVLIASGAGWTGDVEKFCRGMVAAGFLDKTAEGFVIHNWHEWAGYHVEQKAKAAGKKAAQRAKKRADPERPPVVPGTVPGTSPGQGGGQAPISTTCPRDVQGDASLLSTYVVSASSLERLPTLDEKRSREHPRTAALLASLAAKGCFLGHAEKLPTRSAVEAALETAPDGVESRVLVRWAKKKKPTIGWYLDDITGSTSTGGDVRYGSVAPASAEAFGKGGVRAIE